MTFDDVARGRQRVVAGRAGCFRPVPRSSGRAKQFLCLRNFRQHRDQVWFLEQERSGGSRVTPEGCTYSDRGPEQGFPSGPVRLVRNPEIVPMMADGSHLRSGGETWGPVSPDNDHETGVWSLDGVDSSS
jgi:hypothetical protein